MKRLFWLLIPLFLWTTDAAGFNRVGTAAAQFLKFGVGARSLALAGTGVALAGDPAALYWNPAGMKLGRSSVFYHQTNYFVDMGHRFMGLGVPWGRHGALGLSLNYVSVPDQEVTTLREPDGNGLYYNFYQLATGVSLMRELTDRLTFGVTGKYIREQLYNEWSATLAADLGLQYSLVERALLLGFSVANFGGNMKLQGKDLLLTGDVDRGLDGDYPVSVGMETREWPLPLIFRMGLRARILGRKEALMPSYRHDILLLASGDHLVDNRERLNLGLEYAFRGAFLLRGGWRFFTDSEGLTLGAGWRLRLPAGGGLSLDYAWLAFGDLGEVHAFTAIMEI